MRAKHEYDDKGNHRLGISKKVKGDLTQDAPFKWGKWASYKSPAVFKRGKTTLYAVTDFYTGSVEFPDPTKLYIVSVANSYTLE